MKINFLHKQINIKYLIITFFVSRVVSTSLIYILLPLYDQRFFTFKDLEFYKENNLGILSPNFLFSYLIKLTNYDSSNIHNFAYVAICFIVSFLFFLPWIFLVKRIMSFKNAFLYTLILGMHPYLSLYSLKLDSTTFAVLPVGLFAIQKFLDSNKFKFIGLSISTLSTFFRSQIIILAWSQFILYFNSLKSYKISRSNLFYFFILLILVGISIIQFNYGADIVTQNFGCYSFIKVKEFLINKGVFNPISHILSLVFTPIIHFFLLLGAREAIAAFCINLPKQIASISELNILSTLTFLTFHFYAFIKMFIWVTRQRNVDKLEFFIPFAMLLPNLYGAAHMRYLICLIPYLIIFIFRLETNKISKSI